jgi:hypothetical protein
MPLVTVTREILSANPDNSCPICLSEMALEEKIRILPCKHMFHNQVQYSSTTSAIIILMVPNLLHLYVNM